MRKGALFGKAFTKVHPSLRIYGIGCGALLHRASGSDPYGLIARNADRTKKASVSHRCGGRDVRDRHIETITVAGGATRLFFIGDTRQPETVVVHADKDGNRSEASVPHHQGRTALRARLSRPD